MALPVVERSASIRQSLKKVLASEGFRRGRSLCRFLAYVVEAVLDGRSAELKEYSLGIAVFGRGDDFDCRLDPIVRVQARKLRTRLLQYYRSDGGDDPVWIELPKGGYTPAFHFREPAARSASQARPAADSSSAAPERRITTLGTGDRNPILHLVGRIYDAAQDPARWPDFLEDLADAVRGDTTVLLAHDYRHSQTNVVTGVRFDQVFQREFDEYYSTINPWTIHGRAYMLPGLVYTGQMACSDEDFARSEFYNDYLRKLQLFYSLGGTILKQGERGAFISSVRAKAAGGFADSEIEIFQLLLPHLRRALDLHRNLVFLEGQRDASAGALDALPYGCLLLDQSGKPLLMNRAAADIMRRNDGLQLASGNLAPADRQESVQLERLIREAASTSIGKGLSPGGSMCISRPSGRRAYLIVVSPMSSGTFLLGRHQAFVILFVSDPEAEPANRAEMMRRFFGLTNAEAQLASMLLDGHDVRQAAERLAISQNTARTHIRRIFEKTGTSRQAELVRLLLTTPALADRHKP